jgi:DNA repair photolyase
MARYRDPIRGRGTNAAPPNRFEAARFEPDAETGFADDETPDPRSQFIADATKSALSVNQSPDVGFDVGLNPYRGCEHGCIYCYARPTHEYLGYSAGLDFETRILVKHELPQLLRAALSAKSWKPQTIGISGVTDAYQPIERKLEITRRSLAVLAEFRNPCAIITKSRLVVRDTDLLQDLAQHEAVSVTISLTTLDPELARRMEPRAAQPRARLWTIEQLARAGVPVGVNLAPIVPGLTEHEIPALVAAAADAGAKWAGWQLVRLPYAVKDLFAEWLAAHYPDRREKVLHRIADVRDGKLNASDFAVRQRGTGLWSEQIAELVALARRRSGIPGSWPLLSVAAFRRPGAAQLRLL